MDKIPIGSNWAHVKTGGPYVVMGFGTLQTNTPGAADLDGALCVIYARWSGRGMETLAGGRAQFVRPLAEFLDGRFVRLDDAE